MFEVNFNKRQTGKIIFLNYTLWQDEECADEKEEKKAEEKEEKAISLFGALKIPGVVEFSLW